MQFIVTGMDGSDDEAMQRRMAARTAHLKLGDEMELSARGGMAR